MSTSLSPDGVPKIDADAISLEGLEALSLPLSYVDSTVAVC